MTTENSSSGESSATNTEQTSAPNKVEIHNASDAALNSFLSKSVKEDEKIPEVESQEGDNEPQAESEADQPEAEQLSQTPEQTQVEQPSQPTVDVETQRKQELEQLQARLQAKDRYIDKRNWEIGQLRKELKQVRAELKKGIEEKMVESPSDAIEEIQKITKIDEALSDLDAEQQQLEHTHATERAVAERLPITREIMQGMAEVLYQDGINPGFIQQFAQNPYAHATASELVHLAKRAELLNHNRALAQYAKQLQGKLQEAEKKPQKIVQQLSQSTARKPGIDGSVSGMSNATSRKVSVSDVASLSDEQLAELSKSLA